jgi:hypothetical protein
MIQYLLIAALVTFLAVPALAAKRWYKDRDDRCRIVNVAPYYTQTTIRKGKRVYVTRPLAQRDMAIICD